MAGSVQFSILHSRNVLQTQYDQTSWVGTKSRICTFVKGTAVQLSSEVNVIEYLQKL